ncbi:MAG: L,D-transpeptidase family protein [Deltaproteobacteria bacterium]|jgi:lipoprotein-anchoring transpeptidase ErfK/SrfK/ketosteroid isomerase-like protein|nr:L,D-transpeptidase family protein [Deltaproteobacteria bacterium]
MPARPARAALAIVLALALFPALAGAREPDPLLPDAIILPGGQAGLIMVVNKAEQRLLIYRHDGLGNVWLERIVPCSTGMVQGDKLVRGDKKTPEGFYVFRQKLLPSELPDIYGTLAYPMDYPNFWDRKIGRGGDGIWTHGINKPLVDYDSNGCIEMLNHDIAALEAEIRLHDTPILVYEDLALERSDLLREEGDGIAAFVEAWRQAWTASDIARYASFYDRGFFNTDELPFQGWMDRKARVAAGYRRIEVGIADLRVFRHRDTVVASFTQSYRGDDRFQSVGHKRLYIKGGPGDWRIVAEEYGPLPGTPPDKWLTAQEKRDALTTPPLAVAQLSEPMASASAGVILPSGPTLVAASQPQEPQSEAQAAADEATRVSLEQTTRNQGPGVTVLASLASQEGPDDVSSDSGLSRPLVASASSGVALPATAQTAGNGQDAPPRGRGHQGGHG